MNIGDTWILKEDDGTEIEMVVIDFDEENGVYQSISINPS